MQPGVGFVFVGGGGFRLNKRIVFVTVFLFEVSILSSILLLIEHLSSRSECLVAELLTMCSWRMVRLVNRSLQGYVQSDQNTFTTSVRPPSPSSISLLNYHHV